MVLKEPGEPIYPCQFPVKVIGENNKNLETAIIKEMSSFDEVINPAGIKITHSKNKKYLSITFTINARSREDIDQVYSALNAQKEEKMDQIKNLLSESP